ncbi:hypothetical protein [Brevibacillus massiliensis]|nr:hypothetical protein [Brevibacillus massiliensis]
MRSKSSDDWDYPRHQKQSLAYTNLISKEKNREYGLRGGYILLFHLIFF